VLWQSPILSGGTVSRYISGSHQYCPWYCQQKHVWQPPVLAGFLSADISCSHQYGLALEVVIDTSARKEMDLEIFSF
jgi:hypothetical protein